MKAHNFSLNVLKPSSNWRLIWYIYFSYPQRFLRCINEHFLLPSSFGFRFLVHFSVVSIFSFVWRKQQKKLSLRQTCTQFSRRKSSRMWWANDGKWCLKTSPSTTINLDHEYRWTILQKRTRQNASRRVVFPSAKTYSGKILSFLSFLLWVLFSFHKHVFSKEKYAEQINGKSFHHFSLFSFSPFVPMLFMILPC